MNRNDRSRFHNIEFRRRGMRWMQRTRHTTQDVGPQVDTRPTGRTSLSRIRKDSRR